MLMIDSDHEKKSLGIFLITRVTVRSLVNAGAGYKWKYCGPSDQ
jgi:hypothetical protein